MHILFFVCILNIMAFRTGQCFKFSSKKLLWSAHECDCNTCLKHFQAVVLFIQDFMAALPCDLENICHVKKDWKLLLSLWPTYTKQLFRIESKVLYSLKYHTIIKTIKGDLHDRNLEESISGVKFNEYVILKFQNTNTLTVF